jgi:outer membrane protein OmpA-like peptidoglycan-associated protein
MGHKKRAQGQGVRYENHYPNFARFFRIGSVFFFLSSVSFAQGTFRPVRLGIGAGIGSNISHAYIEAYEGSFLCGVFEKGSAPGLSLPFVQAEIPLSENFSFFPRLRYQDLSSTFTTQNFTIPRSLDTNTNSLFSVNREREYQTNLKTISFDALFSWRLTSFHLGAGLGAGFIIHHSYEQTEKLLSPNVVYKENSLSSRTVKAGDFETKSITATAEFAIGYDIALSSKWNFSPEIRASIPITPISSVYSYKTNTFSFAVALMYALPTESLPKEELLPIEIPKPPPIAENTKEEVAPAKSILSVAVKAIGITESGEEVPQPVVEIQNVRVTDVAPTLNYVFFDDGSAEIPSRYHFYSNPNEARSFNPSSLYKSNALGIHYEVLNILGLRMQQKPNSKITITGTRSLHSSGDSVAASDISLLRAEHAAKYLQEIWGIAPSRIRIKSRSLPEQASDENTATGQGENRRIEITTTTPSLLEPIETHRLERTATPPKISFQSVITSNYNDLKSQIITIRQGSKIIKTIDGLSASGKGEMLWDIAEGNVIENNDPVTWQMEIIDSADNHAIAEGSITFKKQEETHDRHVRDTTADKSLERFHLLLFDYSSSAELNKIPDQIFDRIASSVTQDSRVSLIGHTDITGDPNYNEHLSYDRASRASLLLSSRLRKLGKSAPSFNLEARGAKDILFDNTNAEGRFLSRTVRITIERDLKK